MGCSCLPGGAIVSQGVQLSFRGCSCLLGGAVVSQGVQLSQLHQHSGRCILLVPTTLLVLLRQLHPLTAPLKSYSSFGFLIIA